MAGHLDTDDFKVAIASDLLADIPRSFLETILPRCLLVDLDEGQTLIERGLGNEYLFLLLSGSLRVQLDDGQLPHHLVLDPGECVGEVSVIDGRGASGSVISIGKSRLLRIDRETLWYLVGATEAAAEEFAALLPSAGLEQAELVAERLRQPVLGLPIVVDEESNAGANVTISLGVAQLKPGDSLATLTAAADAALYRAKSEGRNCVRGAKR